MSNTILKCFNSQCPLVRSRLLRTPGAPAALRTIRPARRPTHIHAETNRRGGLGDEDIDVAVFRFTLGIPGFDDRLIPRVVGAVLGTLLVINHIAGVQPTPEAQLRSEWLAALLAALCLFVPDIEERLREAMPGRGRQKTSDNIEGSTNCFFLEPSLPEASKKELAWASFSLLKNTNCCGLLVAAGGRVLLARGALGSRVVQPGDAAGSLAAMSQDLAANGGSKLAELVAAAAGSGSGTATQQHQQLWLPERSGFGPAGMQSLAALPAGAQCLLAQRIDGGAADGRQGVLVVFSERPRALTERERAWVGAVADKLAAFV
ncbi:hypothetical protein PLESTB_001543200 [Pleodorina starrii]|uniref:Uncharacterized protein n=1 Tax=Pleodorina starrii TaxID=330485 RepID=A0A9W6BYH3_9CHLO|nr:hypothetical protein PLESTM_002000200 [Pleodorina starrii]GLC59856.1 hypothetical protein PLESTB_001543200 [Pleodorina starrii]GLC69107.1 hypothetical protein PLESTF_000789900 [Pleodorina starrii]